MLAVSPLAVTRAASVTTALAGVTVGVSVKSTSCTTIETIASGSERGGTTPATATATAKAGPVNLLVWANSDDAKIGETDLGPAKPLPFIGGAPSRAAGPLELLRFLA